MALAGTLNVCSFSVGASFTFCTLTVIVAVRDRPRLSVAETISEKLGVASKLSAAALATVI